MDSAMQPPSDQKRKAVYIVNDFWLYRLMARCSIATLRAHNPDLRVEVHYVSDAGANNRDLGGMLTRVAGLPRVTADEFREECARLGASVVEVRDIDMGGEPGYTPAQRGCLTSVGPGRVLLLDADTFVFGSVDPILDMLDGADFVADRNSFGERRSMEYRGRTMSPFNSGVVAWGDGWLPRYASQVARYCVELRDGSHPMSRWLHENTTPGCGPPQGREELACSLFVLDNGLRYAYTTKSQVQTGSYMGGCIVHHTLAQNWADAYARLRGAVEARKSLPFRLLGGKTRFT